MTRRQRALHAALWPLLALALAGIIAAGLYERARIDTHARSEGTR